MTTQLTIQKTVYKVSDYLGWQRDGTLILSPSFQRRPVWRPIAKSFLIDTIVKGFPIPVIYIRERVELERQVTTREVVDGQQRLRTIISFVAREALKDYREDRDEFTVQAIHNPDIAGKPFSRLPSEIRSAILSYEFSTHILSTDTEDRDILQMFSRINSTGTKLSSQELRNAEFFGEFKLTMYELAVEQLDRWRRWGIFSEDQIARMKEVELTSDLVINFIAGLTAKRQPTIDHWYKDYDAAFPGAREISRRFRLVFDELDESIGELIAVTPFSSEVLFFSLVVLAYDLMWGLGSDLSRVRSDPLPPSFASAVLRAAERIEGGEAPTDVLDAVRRAPVDAARRRVRHNYLRRAVGAGTSRT